MHFIDLFKKSYLLLLLRGVSLLLTLGISLFISNLYGVKTTGIYYLFISILMGLSIIGKFGLDNSLIKYVAQFCKTNETHFIRNLWNNATKVSFFICIIIITLIIIGIKMNVFSIFASFNNETLIYAIACLIPFTFFGLNIATIRGLNNLLTASLFESLLLPSTFLIIMFLFHFNTHSNNILPAYLYSTILLMVTTHLYLLKHLRNNNDAKTDSNNDLLKTSYPIFGINFLNFLSNWGATFILAAYTSLESIGIYNVGWRIITIASIFTLVFNNINAPVYSQKFKSGKLFDIEHLSRNTCIILTIIGLPLTSITILYAEPILGLFGDEFIKGAFVLQILMLGQLISFITGSVGYLLLMTGYEKHLRKIALYVTSFQILLYIVFVPIYDITAAAIITSGSIAMRNILAVYVAYKHIHIISLPIPYRFNITTNKR